MTQSSSKNLKNVLKWLLVVAVNESAPAEMAEMVAVAVMAVTVVMPLSLETLLTKFSKVKGQGLFVP